MKVKSLRKPVKVAYNNCYGGFSLSIKAQDFIAKKLGYSEEDLKRTEDAIFPKYLKEEITEKVNKVTECRHHPLLIECIETLGEEANSYTSKIHITEVTTNIYKIREYDGMEIVEELFPYEYEEYHCILTTEEGIVCK